MVEETRHGDALLETDGEDVAPFVLCVPGAGAVEDVGCVDGREVGEEVGVGDVFGAHLAEGVRVDELLAQGAAGEVGALRDVEDGVGGGFVHRAAVDGPQATKDAEEGGFAAAVGADDEGVLAWVDGEGEGGDEGVAGGGDDGDAGEGDVGGRDGGAAGGEGGGGGDEVFFVVVGKEVVHHVEEGGYAGGVAG